MQFTCTKENIAHGLHIVCGLASKPSHLPILSHIRITATESGVTLVATNLEVAIRAFVRAKVEVPGEWTVPAKTLLDYVSLLPEEQIRMSLEGTELIVSCGRTSTKIKGITAEEYPVIPDVEEDAPYLLGAEVLKQSLAQVAFAAAKNEIRPELSGIYMGCFVREKQGIFFAATDSYRLAERFVPLTTEGQTREVIIPGKTAMEFIRLIGFSLGKDGVEQDVRIWLSQTQIALRFDTFEVTSRLVDGTYPDYTQIIPQAFQTTVVFSKDALVNSMKASSLFTTTGINAVSLVIKSDEGAVTVSSTSTQTGAHETVLDTEVIGVDNDIVLNHKYVLEGMQHVTDGDVELKMNDKESPCLFLSKTSDAYKYIVMPIRQ
ncbi:MAG: DNA polymerase III subunit beta [Candidatus Magasanikbacteria bacterium]|nr:DNA polymerase III subunit beta [Candidatus Magasanikbacteria bacterium]